METIVLNVEGMTCSHCETSVTRELKKVRGVANATASAPAGTATATYDPSLATLKDLEAAVTEAGYSVAGPATAGTAARPAQGQKHDGHAMGHGGGHGGHGGHGCCH